MASVVLGGDVMLGRGIGPLALADPQGMVEGIRFLTRSADLFAVNLEAPLSDRGPEPGAGIRLVAPTATVAVLENAGVDVVGVANNHASDAGVEGLADTRATLSSSGIVPVGRADASCVTVPAAGLRVAFCAFDATGSHPAGGPVATWDPAAVEAAVRGADAGADTVIVGLHGGIEYLLDPDPTLTRLAADLAGWGADVVWGHGAHVVQPVTVTDPDADGRPTVVATSLGNLLFDQGGVSTRRGALLEVLATGRGVAAFRVAAVDLGDRRARFEEWVLPEGDAVQRGGSWWSLTTTVSVAERHDGMAEARTLVQDPVTAAYGPVTGGGAQDLVVVQRRVAGERRGAGPVVVDERGRSTHVGVYVNGRERWVGSAVERPVRDLAACDGSLVIAFAPDGATAWEWGEFGFATLPTLPGPVTVGCADVDGDGRTEPVALGRGVADRACGVTGTAEEVST